MYLEVYCIINLAEAWLVLLVLLVLFAYIL